METPPVVSEDALLRKIIEQNHAILQFHAAEDQKLNLQIRELGQIRGYLRDVFLILVVFLLAGIVSVVVGVLGRLL